MSFLKCGCGCVVLPVNSKSFDKKEWIIRVVDYCGGSGEGYPRIGIEERLGSCMLPENVEKAYFLTPDECKPYFVRLAALVEKGHQFEALRFALKPLIEERKS